jgi:hypothetical protein
MFIENLGIMEKCLIGCVCPKGFVRRIRLFLIILAVSLGFLLILLAASLILAAIAPALYQSSWIHQMWGGMGGVGGMGNGGGMMGGGGYAPSYLWIIPAALIGIALVGVIGVVFYVIFPEIVPVVGARERAGNGSVPVNPKVEPVPPPPKGLSGPQNAYESVSKTLTPEERRVLNVLTAHQGKYLQKYIRREAGLSRLKTHRIIARFAERGIVSLKKSGNTNEVYLSDWLKDSKVQSPA